MLDIYGDSHKLGKVMEWDKWMRLIPFLEFKKDWKVKIVPPFGGAMIRFHIRKRTANVSVYLDCHNVLSCAEHPYWEIYPYEEDDRVYRTLLEEDTTSLLNAIEESIEYQLRDIPEIRQLTHISHVNSIEGFILKA